MELSIVIGTYNRFEMLKGCIALLRSSLENAYSDYRKQVEIFVIDSGSTDGSREWLIQQPDIVTIVHHRFADGMPKRTWGNFMNMGFKSSSAEWVMMISDDTFVLPETMKNVKGVIDDEKDGVSNTGAFAFPFHDVYGNRDGEYKTFELFGQLVLNHGLYNKKAFEKIGYANDKDFELYGSDSDICFRMIQNGYIILTAHKCLILHDMRAHNHPTQTGYVNDLFNRDVRDTLYNKWKDCNFLWIPDDPNNISPVENIWYGPKYSAIQDIIDMLDSISKKK